MTAKRPAGVWIWRRARRSAVVGAVVERVVSVSGIGVVLSCGSFRWLVQPYDVSEHLSSTFVQEVTDAAELYYRDQLSQQEVAQRLGVSRSTVSRMLQVARDEGIVHIEIRRPSSPERLSEELRSALGLRRVVVTPASSRSGLHVLAAPAVEEIARLALAPGDAMAVSWGSTIEEIARSRQFPPLHGVHLIPAIAAFDEIDARFQTNEIARRIAALAGADVDFLHSPAMPSQRLRRTLLADEDVSRRLALWDRLAAAARRHRAPDRRGGDRPGPRPSRT